MALDVDSETLSPLPSVLSHGLVAVSTFGLLSFFCSTSLFLFLTYRLIKWNRTASERTPVNQFLFLIYNLLLADIQQALAFLLNISHLRNNAIEVGTTTCFVQGWFVSTGDLASSVFICAIACHTFLGVVKDYRLPTTVFYSIIGFLWTFIYLMAALGPIMHHENFYTRASAWVKSPSSHSFSAKSNGLTQAQCWISDVYQNERLWLHYFWIFICMFSTVLIYAFIFIYLHRNRTTSKSTSPESNSHGATPLMILYPLIYVVCTAPLAAGRISSLAGNHVSLEYFCAAGTMIACNGWLDVILYASTRAEIVFTEFPPGEDIGLDTFAFLGKGHKFGTVTTVEAGDQGGGRLGARIQGGDSVENLYGLDQIGIKGEVTVSVDVAPDRQGPSGYVGSKRVETGRSGSWDGRSSGKSSQIER
ncbi:hypothetical protein D0Z07_1425 [Hyphodiscus hymeniophilus]|uniref:G-protein coupled receptors family 1 profile domain-containing protein n=1 Tax=Hyphodiscus hymeniophilus TaxID=353542 RepID=A0A9P6VR30_9HELO|nr:hypothetical protein D0Z07_1425 [Hyphodiscus hymeniophilus]